MGIHPAVCQMQQSFHTIRFLPDGYTKTNGYLHLRIMYGVKVRQCPVDLVHSPRGIFRRQSNRKKQKLVPAKAEQVVVPTDKPPEDVSGRL